MAVSVVAAVAVVVPDGGRRTADSGQRWRWMAVAVGVVDGGGSGGSGGGSRSGGGWRR